MELVRHHSAMLANRPVDFTWNAVSEFLDHVERTEPVLNVAQLVGHASLRSRAADTLRGAMKPHEQQRSRENLEAAVKSAWQHADRLAKAAEVVGGAEQIRRAHSARERARALSDILKLRSKKKMRTTSGIELHR